MQCMANTMTVLAGGGGMRRLSIMSFPTWLERFPARQGQDKSVTQDTMENKRGLPAAD